jgi:hypothetical protein
VFFEILEGIIMKNLLAVAVLVLAGSLSSAMATSSFDVEIPAHGSHITVTRLPIDEAGDVSHLGWTGPDCIEYKLSLPPRDSALPPLHFRILDEDKPGEIKIGALKDLFVSYEATPSPVAVATYEYTYEGIEDPDFDLVCVLPAAYLEHYDVQVDPENPRLLCFRSRHRG